MQAIVFHEYGSPDVLRLEEVPLPVIGERDVLVRVRAASVNSWDRDNLKGVFANRADLGLRRPNIAALGGDIAGQVEAIGSAVARFAVGDEVFGDLSRSGWGAFADYARAPEEALAPKPAGLGFVQAAAMPQAAVIALQGISDHGDVRAGQRVLINGAGGGVGSFAVQLAKLRDAEVTAVDSSGKLDMLRALGADHVIDYRAQDYTAAGERYDFILDCEVHRPLHDCRRALAPTGRLTVVGGSMGPIARLIPFGLWVRLTSRQRVELLLRQANRNLTYLGELASTGKIRSVIEHEYALAEVPKAMQRMFDGLVVGKAVIRMD
jgi:NADPH:quinone reductase-like Zn-dependent oxidoreductase